MKIFPIHKFALYLDANWHSLLAINGNEFSIQ